MFNYRFAFAVRVVVSKISHKIFIDPFVFFLFYVNVFFFFILIFKLHTLGTHTLEQKTRGFMETALPPFIFYYNRNTLKKKEAEHKMCTVYN